MDYYKILNEGESNRKCYEENGKIVLVTEKDAPSKSNSHKVRNHLSFLSWFCFLPKLLFFKLNDVTSFKYFITLGYSGNTPSPLSSTDWSRLNDWPDLRWGFPVDPPNVSTVDWSHPVFAEAHEQQRSHGQSYSGPYTLGNHSQNDLKKIKVFERHWNLFF